MRCLRNSIAMWAAALLVTALPSATRAQIFPGFKPSIGLDVSAGLDDKTQAFIREMVPEVRAQIYGLLKDALPLIDNSVQSYMSRVDEIMTKQINNLQCSISGAGRTFTADLKSQITGREPAPIQRLKGNETAAIGSFSIGDDPGTYERRYADFLADAALTRCEVGASPEASASVAVLQSEVRPRWWVWFRLNGECPNADKCFDYLASMAAEVMNNSDSRDKTLVNAEDRLKGISKPNSTKSGYDPSDYERKLGMMFGVLDSVNVARLARLSAATEAWNKASKAAYDPQSEMNKLYANEVSQVNWPTDINQDYRNAIGRCKTLVTMLKAISSDAKFAAEHDSKYKPEYDKLRVSLQQKLDGTYQLYQKAAFRLNTWPWHDNLPPKLPVETLP